VVRGVRYQAADGLYELHAELTVGSDGRFSRVRKLSGLGTSAVTPSQPMDVLWLRLPRHADETHGASGRVGNGHFFIELERGAEWQIGLIIPKGSFATLRAKGIEALRRILVDTAPELADRVDTLVDWKQVSLLTVQADRLTQWYKPGLLLIGDAAHVMSPVGGNGINYAIMDAVATSNLLTAPLQAGHVTPGDLARVQKRRERPVQMIQAIVNQLQEVMIGRVLQTDKPFHLPGIVHLPFFSDVAARVVGFGIRPEHVAKLAGNK
jgi:2-polyprenyl-6-methoxyphenol hydroxylase-like FAD-dependent oxidoreductase